jgi:hypothetical protein
MELALGILGTILGLAALTLSLYNTVILKVELSVRRPAVADNPYYARESARSIISSMPQGSPTDNLGMPDVYDPVEEFGSIEEFGL